MHADSQDLLRTPLFEAHRELGGRMVPFAGYSMPIRYTSQIEEHHAVRSAAGLFDVSHMGEVFVAGPEAAAFLQFLTPNDVSKLRIGRAHYNALLDERGCFIDDLLIYRRAKDSFLLVVNAANRDRDLDWISDRADGFEVEIEDRSDEYALLALQGPAAARILGKLTDADLGALRYYSFVGEEVAGVEAIVSRTGYTGEDGFELYVASDHAAALWRRLLSEGEDEGLKAAGLAARDTLRLEAGMMLSGQDIDAQVTPLEAGLGWFVKLDKGVDFIGSARLREQKQSGLQQHVIGFELEGRAMARTGYEVAVGEASGVVSSGSWSPTLEASIGIARLQSADIESAELFAKPKPGSPMSATIRGSRVDGSVRAFPFYKRA